MKLKISTKKRIILFTLFLLFFLVSNVFAAVEKDSCDLKDNNITTSSTTDTECQDNSDDNSSDDLNNNKNKRKFNFDRVKNNKNVIQIKWGNVKNESNLSTGMDLLDFSGKIEIVTGSIVFLHTISFDKDEDIFINTGMNWISKELDDIDGIEFEIMPFSGQNLVKFKLTVGRYIENKMIEIDMNNLSKNDKILLNQEISNNSDLRIIVKLKKVNKNRNFASDIEAIVNPVYVDDLAEMLENIDENNLNNVKEVLLDNKKLGKDYMNKFMRYRDNNSFKKHFDDLFMFSQVVCNEVKDVFGDMVKMKIDLLDKIEELKRNIDSKNLYNNFKDKLMMIENTFASYNFIEDCIGEVRLKMDDLNNYLKENNIDKKEIENKIKFIIDLSKNNQSTCSKYKFEKRLIPFVDTDDNEWFTKNIQAIKDLNIVQGYKSSTGLLLGEFRPSNNITIAEALKIAIKTAGIEVGHETDPWYQVYTDKAKSIGLSIMSKSLNPNFLARRSEVIRMILEVYGIEPSNTKVSPFKDLSINHPDFGYVVKAYELGIISGDTDKQGNLLNTVRPDGNINRAEVVKIVKYVLDLVKNQNN